ncbi:MAG: sulfate transporter [Spirochaetaceae bacterium]|nr:MAG: sulfate transporter [Spirochaetaceae bacterium]
MYDTTSADSHSLIRGFRFSLEEAAGAFGDYGTLLPIVFAVAAVTEMDLSLMLLFFGAAYIVTGLVYRLPIPVEPMKAVGILAIGGGLSAAEIAGVGLSIGVLLLVIALTGAIEPIRRALPLPVIRGIQLGLAASLILQSGRMGLSDPYVAAGAIIVILVVNRLSDREVSALAVLVIGIVLGIIRSGPPAVATASLPSWNLPAPEALLRGFLLGTVPQLPLTLGNAVLATSLMVADLSNTRVKNRSLLLSMSALCLAGAPFGAFPICHGAGGLAAQHRFGARSGGSNIISGVVLVAVALLFATPQLGGVLPFGVLAALLLFSGIALGKSGWKSTDRRITVLVAGLAVLVNLPVAVAVGAGAAWISRLLEARR